MSTIYLILNGRYKGLKGRYRRNFGNVLYLLDLDLNGDGEYTFWVWVHKDDLKEI